MEDTVNYGSIVWWLAGMTLVAVLAIGITQFLKVKNSRHKRHEDHEYGPVDATRHTTNNPLHPQTLRNPEEVTQTTPQGTTIHPGAARDKGAAAVDAARRSTVVDRPGN